RGDLEAIPLDDASVDAAVLMLVLSYVSEPPAVLKEMSRIIKPGGKAVIVDLLPHDREDFRQLTGQPGFGFEPLALQKALTDAGFIDARIVPLPPEPNARGPALFLATATPSPSGRG